MTSINGQDFKIYDLDTTESFKIRVASMLKTLPEYLFFKENIDLSVKNNDIEVVNFLDYITQSGNKNSSIAELVGSILEKDKEYNIRESVFPIWIAYNKSLIKKYKSQSDDTVDKVLKEVESNKIKGIYSSTVKEALKNAEKNKERLKEDIEKNDKKAENYEEMFKNFEKTKINPFTEFNPDYISSTLILESKNSDKYNLSLLELFNECILSPFVPFITTQNFYKILQGFIPSDEWVKTFNDSILLKVASKIAFDKTNMTNYTDTIIKVDEKSRDITADITIYTSKKGGDTTKEEYTNRFLSIFNGLNLNVKESNESKISGTFYFLNKKIDKYVFSDLVMNDDLFKTLLKIDEHESATKKKTYLFIQFYHESTGLVKANISSKVASKLTLLDDQDPSLFPEKSFYISVKVKEAKSAKAVLLFRDMLGKLLTQYDKKAKKVIEFYSEYIEDFGKDVEEKEEEEEKEERKKLSEIAPEIFVSNYTRNCPHIRTPVVIPEELVQSAIESGKSVIKFPRDIPDDPNAVRFPNDGQNQHYYVSDSKQYKYVGLTKNRLRNSDKFPYVPCCFKNDQSTKPKFLNYYEGREISTSAKLKQQDIIKTNKVLDNDRFGSLPYNIDNLFTFIYPNQTYEYVRKGVFRNNHSFLNCVMEALNKKTKILSITDEKERESFLMEIRNNLAKKSYAVLCRQEMYDKNINDIINMLKNPKQYLDPKLFIHLLEDYFECNIFIFTQQNILSDGEMILPRHLQSYYKYKNEYPCIYIYEHPENEKQCELIIKYNTVKEEDPYDLFTHEESRNIRKLFLKLNESYALSTPIKEITIPLKKLDIESQYIDSYGKTRQLNVRYKDIVISLITDPIQPVRAKEMTEKLVKQVALKTALEFVKFLEINIMSQSILNGKIYELNCESGNTHISIPIEESDILEGIPEKKEELNFSLNNLSVLEQYNRNKKIARYLTEYVLWCYSRYLYDKKIKEINDDDITTFGKEKFKIDPTFKYGNISKAFKIDNSFTKKGFIIVHTEDMLKRLLYSLRLAVQRDVKSVLKYRKHVFIQNYYVDITDFTQYPDQVILYGEDSVEHWINENNLQYFLYDTVQIGYTTPYFFKNKLIDDIVYLAQNTTSLEKALDISITWLKKGYNKGIFAKPIKQVSFILYSFINSTNIKKYKIKKESSPFSEEIKIIGYKIENTAYYTVLLNLDLRE